MRRKFLIAAATFTMVLGTVSAASGITAGGELDGDGHPYVGLMVADDADGNPMWRCSGTLISPTVYLTAGHCTSGASGATVWFESDVEAGIPGNGYPFGGPTSVDGTPYTHPMYDDNAFFPLRPRRRSPRRARPHG